MRFRLPTGKRSAIYVGPLGLLIVAPVYLTIGALYLCALMLAPLFYGARALYRHSTKTTGRQASRQTGEDRTLWERYVEAIEKARHALRKIGLLK